MNILASDFNAKPL